MSGCLSCAQHEFAGRRFIPHFSLPPSSRAGVPAGGIMPPEELPDEPADKIAAIEWSIALTAKLLIKHRSGLQRRRPQVERQLRRVLALWLHPDVWECFMWLRRLTRRMRRVTLLSAMQVLPPASQHLSSAIASARLSEASGTFSSISASTGLTRSFVPGRPIQLPE